MSGITRSQYNNQKIYFITLTSSPESDFSKINYHFNRLVKKLRVFNPVEYCKIKTHEGYGVLHVLMRTKLDFETIDDTENPEYHYEVWNKRKKKMVHMPHAWHWLSVNWEKLHKAFIIDVQEYYGETKRISNYLVSNYVSLQGFIRLGYSMQWIFKGACKIWKKLITELKEEEINRDPASLGLSNVKEQTFMDILLERWNHLLLTKPIYSRKTLRYLIKNESTTKIYI